MDRRFPPPWTVERLPGGFKVIDANGQSLAYFYARENDYYANTAGVLMLDEARRMASNFAKLPELLGRERRLRPAPFSHQRRGRGVWVQRREVQARVVTLSGAGQP